MILEMFYKEDANSEGSPINILEDNIKEFRNEKDFVTFIRVDDKTSLVDKRQPTLTAMYLLNDEGKTLKKIV